MNKSQVENISGYKHKQCRICKSRRLYRFLDLGKMPIPNGFIASLHAKEPLYPLGLCVCENCWLVQLTYTIPAELMFRNYVYIPSTSVTMTDHFQKFAIDESKRFGLGTSALVIDIGSNDGTLLSCFKSLKTKILGIDPAENLAKKANKDGIPTLNEYFSPLLASDIVTKYGKAKLITATNVIAHIDNLHEVCEGIKKLLDTNGVFIIEAPYLIDLLDRNEFDTVYHEHLSYFSIKPLTKLCDEHGLEIFDVRKFSVHGGTIRIYISHRGSFKTHPRVDKILFEEKLKKLDQKNTYDEFGFRTKQIRRDITSLLKRIKKQGKRVVGYGASAKGNVLLNYCNLSSANIEYIVDSIPYKQGKLTPGTHISIYPESKLLKDNPDYALVLSWNFADEIIQKNVTYREKGGQFIVPVPYLKIV